MNTRNSGAITERNGLPEEWEWSTLGDVSEKPQYGWTTKANHNTGKLKLLRTTDITSGSVDWSSVPFCTVAPEDVEKYLVESGDVLISRAGSVGVSFLIYKPERAVFASYLIRFHPKKEIDTKYFYYYLKSPAYWEAIGASKSGIAVPNVNASKLAQVPIPVAPLDQQKRIVAEIEKQFSRLDEAVANLKRIKANLKRYKAAVLKAAVEGRLVETEAELAAQGRANVAGGTMPGATARQYESGEELLKRILAERRRKWEENELAKMKVQGKAPKDDNWKKKYKEPAAPDTADLPELPEGWSWVAVEQLSLQVQYGYTASAVARESGVRFLRITDIQEDHVDWSTVPSCDISAIEQQELLLQCGDIVFARTGATVGKSFQLKGKFPESVFASYLIRISPHNVQTSDWLNVFFHSSEYWQQIRASQAGIGQPNVNGTKLRGVLVPLPPLAEQHRIVAEVERRLSVIEELEAGVTANVQRATHLRRSVLQRAFVWN